MEEERVSDGWSCGVTGEGGEIVSWGMSRVSPGMDSKGEMMEFSYLGGGLLETLLLDKMALSPGWET